MAGLVDKAGQAVSDSAPHVIGALTKLRFFIIGLPLLAVAIGIVAQAIVPERHIVSATFKMGSFSAGDEPTSTVPLAGEEQMKARMRATGREIRDEYDGGLLLTMIVKEDVVNVTATANGIDAAKTFLTRIVEKEVAFHNGRLEKLIGVQDERIQFLEEEIEALGERVGTVTEARDRISQTNGDVAAWVALQQARMDAQDKIASFRRQLNDIALARASDLFVDVSAIVQPPVVVIASRWYRPVLYGAIAMAIGLGLALLLVIVVSVRALARRMTSARQ